LKTHAKHLTIAGVLTPIALAAAAAIANEAQTVLGLDLHGSALAIFLVGFVAGASLAVHGQLRLEAQKILAELGTGELDLGAVLGGLSGLFPTTEPSPAKPAEPVAPRSSEPLPPAPTFPPPAPPAPPAP